MKRMGEIVVWVVLVIAALPFVLSAVLLPTVHSVISALLVVGIGVLAPMVVRGISAACKHKSAEQ